MNTTTLEHKFKIGDTIFTVEMCKAKTSVVTDINLTITKDRVSVSYITTDSNNDMCYSNNQAKCFGSQDELINFLLSEQK